MNRFLIASCLVLPLMLLFLGAFHPIIGMDQDLGRHFLTGKIILDTKTIPATNLFSYTYPSFPFVNHHWLSSVILYATYSGGGVVLLFFLQILLLCFPFLLLSAYCLKKGIHPVVICLVAVVYIAVVFERPDLRPELFSFVLFTLYIVLLYQFREKSTKLIFILPLLELLWVNLHIYFFIGILLIFLFFVDSVVGNHKKIYLFLKKKGSLPSQITIIGLTLGGVVLASAINPQGIHGLLYPLFVFKNYGYSIEENQNIFFLWSYSQKPTILFFSLASLLLWTGLLFSQKKRLVDYLIACTFTLLAVTQIRNFPLFAYATFIPCVYAWSYLYTSYTQSKKKFPMLLITLFWVGVFSLTMWGGNTTLKRVGVGFGMQEHIKPSMDFFIKNDLPSPIFNNFDIGSYLEYRLYPKYNVFVDGRPEAYPSSFFQKEYIPMQEDPSLFEKLSKSYGFKTIVFSHTDQTPWAQTFLQSITTNPQWAIVYIDDTILILLKHTDANTQLIKEFEITKNSKGKIYNREDSMSLLKQARLYSLLGWKEKEEVIYHHMLQNDPNSCVALSRILLLLEEKRDPSSSIFATKFNTSCR